MEHALRQAPADPTTSIIYYNRNAPRPELEAGARVACRWHGLDLSSTGRLDPLNRQAIRSFLVCERIDLVHFTNPLGWNIAMPGKLGGLPHALHGVRPDTAVVSARVFGAAAAGAASRGITSDCAICCTPTG
ncbi:hypothetical protein HS125_09925 [bacterium]|nr:hypothetical protein [bacterium]